MEKGLGEEKIGRLSEYRTDPLFSDRERTAIEFGERMALDHTSLDDDFFKRLRSQFSDAEIVELGMAAGQYIGLGRFVRALDLEGRACDI